MKKILSAAIAAIIILTGVMAYTEGFETWYVGAESGLNLRTAPNTNSAIITTYASHTPLTVIGTNGGEWWEVCDGERQGWVHSHYLVKGPDETVSLSNTNEIGECIGTFYATGYTAEPCENGGYSVDCFGRSLYEQIGDIIAVDPGVIPLGRTVYIEGVGYRTARDTGGAIKGNRIDILTGSNAESYSVTGYRKVYLVN